MAGGADQGGARLTETLQVHLMTDAVSRPGKMNAVLLRDVPQIPVVVCIFKPDLNRVVVNVTDRQVGFYHRYAQRLELQVGHCTGGILSQCLIYSYSYLFVWYGPAGDKMRLNAFLCH